MTTTSTSTVAVAACTPTSFYLTGQSGQYASVGSGAGYNDGTMTLTSDKSSASIFNLDSASGNLITTNLIANIDQGLSSEAVYFNVGGGTGFETKLSCSLPTQFSGTLSCSAGSPDMFELCPSGSDVIIMNAINGGCSVLTLTAVPYC
jgi:hypothetical protein